MNNKKIKMNKQQKILVIFIILISITAITIVASTYPFYVPDEPMVRTEKHKYKEADYVNAYCKGKIEYVLPDKTRVDCLTDEYAIEFDWGKKWAECIGQALYYAKMTGKKPACAIIMTSPKDERFITRIEKVGEGITIFKIKAY